MNYLILALAILSSNVQAEDYYCSELVCIKADTKPVDMELAPIAEYCGNVWAGRWEDVRNIADTDCEGDLDEE